MLVVPHGGRSTVTAVLFQVGPCETGTVSVGGPSFKEVRMITEISKEKLIEVGSRFRANYLVDQSGYTLGLAGLDGKPLNEPLPDGFKDEVEAAVGKVDAARKDKALMKAESEHATDVQNEAFKQAKVWRRKVAKRAKNAVEMGKPMPEGRKMTCPKTNLLCAQALSYQGGVQRSEPTSVAPLRKINFPY